jgi:hypothetical protein
MIRKEVGMEVEKTSPKGCADGRRSKLRATIADDSAKCMLLAKDDARRYWEFEGKSIWSYRAVAATNIALENVLLALRSIELALTRFQNVF